jgi:hypothetical protein
MLFTLLDLLVTGGSDGRCTAAGYVLIQQDEIVPEYIRIERGIQHGWE